jgi:hypothetical protein
MVSYGKMVDYMQLQTLPGEWGAVIIIEWKLNSVIFPLIQNTAVQKLET